MSILIKMEMPKTCVECNFHRYHSLGEYVCVATPLLYPMNLANYKCGRKDFCPLIEVPTPHGRLIDADALIADLVKYQNMLDPESRENARVLSVKSYLTLARGEAIIEAED